MYNSSNCCIIIIIVIVIIMIAVCVLLYCKNGKFNQMMGFNMGMFKNNFSGPPTDPFREATAQALWNGPTTIPSSILNQNWNAENTLAAIKGKQFTKEFYHELLNTANAKHSEKIIPSEHLSKDTFAASKDSSIAAKLKGMDPSIAAKLKSMDPSTVAKLKGMDPSTLAKLKGMDPRSTSVDPRSDPKSVIAAGLANTGTFNSLYGSSGNSPYNAAFNPTTNTYGKISSGDVSTIPIEKIAAAEQELWMANWLSAGEVSLDNLDLVGIGIIAKPTIDYETFLDNLVIDERLLHNHSSWVNEMLPWSGTAKSVDNIDEAMANSLPFVGLRRPQAVVQSPDALFQTEIDASYLAGNAPFNFTATNPPPPGPPNLKKKL